MSVLQRPSEAAVAAEHLLEELDMLSAPVDLTAITRKLGVPVSFDVLDDEISGFFVVRDGRPGICVNARHHPNRQRFTLAHEIAHYRLHHTKKAKDNLYLDKSLVYLRGHARSGKQDAKERDADQFAAALLMPSRLVTDYIERHSLDPSEEIDLYRLTMAFRVSEQAMTIRLNELGILT